MIFVALVTQVFCKRHLPQQDKAPIVTAEWFIKVNIFICMHYWQRTHNHLVSSQCLLSTFCMLIVSSQNNHTLMFKQSTCHINMGNENIFDSFLRQEVETCSSRCTCSQSARRHDAWVFKAVNAFIICSPSGDSSSPYEWISVGLSVEFFFLLWHRHSYHSLGVPIKNHPCQECNSSPTIPQSPTRAHRQTCTLVVHVYTWQTTNTVGLTMMDGVRNLAGDID